MNNLKSEHQLRVEAFMLKAKQEVPTTPTEPSIEIRKLRAALILEEALEIISKGLGLSVWVKGCYDLTEVSYCFEPKIVDVCGAEEADTYTTEAEFNMEETIDGCCDLMVVTTGTLSALGVPDKPFQEEVDNNNLAKFGPGHSWRDDGKLLKPPGHKPPRITLILNAIKNGWDIVTKGTDQADTYSIDPEFYM